MPHAEHGEVSLWYESFGDLSGPVVLLINGLGSQSVNFAEDWCRMFVAEGLGVIRFDNRDTGRSTKFDGATSSPAYSISDMAADAVAVLDAAGVARAHVVGFSMGGMIVQRLAIEHPERLLSITSVMSTTGDTDVGLPSKEALAVLLSPSPPDRDGYIARHIEANHIYGSPAHFDPERLAAVAGVAYDRCFCPDGTARQLAAITADGSRTAALGDVRLPALVIHGDQDRLVDISGGRRTAEAIPGARFVAVEGMGHDYPPALWPQLTDLVVEHVRLAERSSAGGVGGTP